MCDKTTYVAYKQTSNCASSAKLFGAKDSEVPYYQQIQRFLAVYAMKYVQFTCVGRSKRIGAATQIFFTACLVAYVWKLCYESEFNTKLHFKSVLGHSDPEFESKVNQPAAEHPEKIENFDGKKLKRVKFHLKSNKNPCKQEN